MPERVDQGLAAAAADALCELDITDDLRTRMRGLPVMLQTSGLTATCAFLLSKVKKPEDSHWITAKILLDEAAKAVDFDQHPDPHVTLDAFARETGLKYVMAESRATMLALWLSRLTQAKWIAQGKNPT